MHGSYTHRVTCNLHPDQFFKITHAAQQFHSRVAPFLRDIALAYLDKKVLLPQSLQQNLAKLLLEIRRIGANFSQIATRGNTYQRLTHDDLRKSAQLIDMLEKQVKVLRFVLESLPDDRQVDGAQER